MLLKKKIQSTTTTFSPTLKASSVTVSNGNLRANCGTTGGACFATLSKTSGKWYYEVKLTQWEGTNPLYMPMVGLGTTTTPFTSPWNTNTYEMFWYYGGGAYSQFIYSSNLRIQYGNYPVQGDIVGVALDMDAKTVYWIKNGVSQGLLNYATYSAGTVFYPVVASPNGQAGNPTIVDWQAQPKYCPAGYGLW
ncbi:hypothetical protein [Ralstonia phage RSL2]|uniref:B30.2/SPRY domain-containing protein n=1 Tax=Ralstonia phage RSL2 TaxID=1585840 RepID=A0A0A8J9M9_9CAUD|nr:hypothetical protein [Ralstonia phage RSL2]